jgi:hypothetical protein
MDFFGFLPLQRSAAQMLFTKDFSSFVHERKPFNLNSSSMVCRLTNEWTVLPKDGCVNENFLKLFFHHGNWASVNWKKNPRDRSFLDWLKVQHPFPVLHQSNSVRQHSGKYQKIVVQDRYLKKMNSFEVLLR